MRRNILNKLAIVFLLPLLFSCGVKKQVVKPQTVVVSPDPVPPVVPLALVPPTTTPATTPAATTTPAVTAATFAKNDILNRIIVKQASFNTLALQAKGDLNIDNKKNSANMTIRIQKDKAIWVSVKVLIEVARVLITPDSIQIMNKLDGTYIKKPFNYIYGFTNKQVNFNTLQSVFVGNSMPEILNDKSDVVMPDKTITVSGDLNDLIYKLSFGENFRPSQTTLKDDKAKQSLTINYKDFNTVSGQEIPQSVTINSIVVDKKIGIDLQYTRVEVDVPVEIPFDIPSRYKVKE